MISPLKPVQMASAHTVTSGHHTYMAKSTEWQAWDRGLPLSAWSEDQGEGWSKLLSSNGNVQTGIETGPQLQVPRDL